MSLDSKHQPQTLAVSAAAKMPARSLMIDAPVVSAYNNAPTASPALQIETNPRSNTPAPNGVAVWLFAMTIEAPSDEASIAYTVEPLERGTFTPGILESVNLYVDEV